MRGVLVVCAMLAATSAASGEGTYRLMHAIGNSEREIARDLSKSACEEMKRDQKRIATILGIHNEALGVGSITCLPESVFLG